MFTGYGPTLPVGDDGMLDASGVLEWGPCPPDAPDRGADGVCRARMAPPPPPGDGNGGGGPGDGDNGDESRDDGDRDGNVRRDPMVPMAPPAPPFSCAEAGDGRCRMYEALPSMLLAMNALPTWAERRSAARDANGGWARVEASRGQVAGEGGDDDLRGAGLRPPPERRACGRGLRREGGPPDRGVGARAAGQGGDERRGGGRPERDGGGALGHLGGGGVAGGRAGGGDVVRRGPEVVHARAVG